MKIFIQSLLFIIIVGLFAVTSDRLTTIEEKETMSGAQESQKGMADQEFLTSMIEHHEGAVSMAKEAQAKSTRPEIKSFAADIISAQTGEIDQMYMWRKDWFGESEHIGMRMGADMPSMAVELGEGDTEFDLRFLDAMIVHHEGAIDTARKVQLPTDRSEIHNLAGSIITAQSQEIDQMKTWRGSWYGK